MVCGESNLVICIVKSQINSIIVAQSSQDKIFHRNITKIFEIKILFVIDGKMSI